MSALIDDLSGPAPVPFEVVKVTTGLGKSREALRRAEQLARSGRIAIYLTRTVRLADELAMRVSPDIRTRVWRGREQPDPDRPGEKMCRELDLVRDAQFVLARPSEVVCPICPRRVDCAYLAQRDATAGIWFAASSLVWHEMPAAMKGACLLIIDEAFALDGLQGLGQPILVGIDDLANPPETKSVGLAADLAVDLMPKRRKLMAALDGQPLGWLSREPLIAAGLTPGDCAEARKAEWRAKVEVKITPKTTILGLRHRLGDAQGNPAVARRALLWHCVDDLLARADIETSGRVEIVLHTDRNTGVTYRALRLYGARPVAKGWAELPTVHLDATADIELIRARVPRAKLAADIVAEEPHVRVVQYPSHTFSQAAMTAVDRGFLVRVWLWAVSYAQQVGGDWLVVLQKAAEELIRGRLAESAKGVPPFIALGHHNALAGIDQYRDVRGIIVIGRTLPAPIEIERISGVWTGLAVPSCGEWYPAEAVTLAARDGSMMTVERDVHPDPLAEAIRRQTCDDELLQIIGRGRGPNRTAANPLEVVILGNVVLPLPLDALRVWAPPTLDDELLAGAGLTLSSGDLAEAFGLNRDQIKKRRQRENRQMGTFAYKDFLYGKVPVCSFLPSALKAATYRRAEARYGTQRVIYDPRMLADIKGWLIDHLGPLAQFEPVSGGIERGMAGTAPADLSKPDSIQTPAQPVPAETAEEPFPAQSVVAEPASPTFPRPIQLDFFFGDPDGRMPGPPESLPDWNGGIAAPPIRHAIQRELRRRGTRHQDLAGTIGLSRPQVTNVLRGRFGTSIANAVALSRLLAGWRTA